MKIAALTAGTLVVVGWFALELPSNAFYSGDSGVKLIAAFNAISHPARPNQIDIPRVNGQPMPYFERFFVLHDAHAHALQSALFPIVSAPFIAAWGLRGAQVLPLVCFVALFPLLAGITRTVAPGTKLRVLFVVGMLAGPVVFYAFEFWEHVPAVACLAAATLLSQPSARPLPLMLGGCFSALAVLLRPESVWYVVALCGWQIYTRARAHYHLAPLVVVLGVFGLANLHESGNILGPHVTANLAPVFDDWFRARLTRVALWFWPGTVLWNVGAAILVICWFAVFRDRRAVAAQTLALAVVAVLATEAASGAYPREALWNCWPVGLLMLVPSKGIDRLGQMRWLSLFTVVAVWLSSTHDGGAQWGPRFVLIAAPAMIVLAAANTQAFLARGDALTLRRLLVAVVLLAGLWTTRSAYRELRGTKQVYAQLVGAIDRNTLAGGIVVFSTWWIDQAAAALYPSRTFLYADSTERARDIAAQLQSHGPHEFDLIWSNENAEDEPVLDAALAGTCYQAAQTHDVEQRAVRILKLECGR